MKRVLLSLLVALSANLLHAQSEALIKAFSESYAQESRGDYAAAINTLKKAYDAGSYETNLRLGWLQYSAGSFNEATTYYQKCIDLRPMSVEARLGYVNAAAAMGNWDPVLNQYLEILKIDPKNSLVNYRAGMIYYGRKDYKTSEKYFETVVNLYPFDYSSLLMLGWSKYFLGKSQEAKVLFNKVLLYSPDDASAKEGLGLIK